MRGVALIAMIAGCSARQDPVAPAVQAERRTAVPAAETLWDRGTFVTVHAEVVLPDTEERFEIYRTADGYRITVRWQRPAPTGELSDGEVTLSTDPTLRPLHGAMVSTIHGARDEVTRSKIQREVDGRLTTEVLAADGSTQTAGSAQPNDWFIGGTITTFLVALCQAGEQVTAPTVYPDKATSLGRFRPVAVDGTERVVTARTLVYAQSRREVTAACEGGKLVGEVARGTTIVRKGDLALARALETQLR